MGGNVTSSDGDMAPPPPWQEKIHYSYTWRLVLAIVNVGVSCGIIASFSIIMLVIYKQRNVRKPSNNFILSMCVTDFAFPAIIAPHFIASCLIGRWPSEWYHCWILAFFNTFLPGTSILNLVLIATDRMVAIFKPTRYRIWLCNRNARILCGIFWFYSFLIACSTFARSFSVPLFDGGVMTCILTGKKFLILQLALEIVPGFTFLVLCYSTIVLKLWQRSANIYTSGKKVAKVNYEIRMAKIGGLVTGFFMLTYMPYYTIIYQYRETCPDVVKLMAGVIVVTSYNFDAFMYGYCNKNYRREIKKLVHRKCPWLVKVTPAESATDTNQDTVVTNTAASTAGPGKLQRYSISPSPIKEESEGVVPDVK